MLGNLTALGALAGSGCDFVGIDAQHGVVGPPELAAGLQFLGARGLPAIVRVMSHEDPLLAHALDFGAGAVLIPMVTQPQDLTRAVNRTHLQPRGTRSVVGERYSQPATGLWDQHGDHGAPRVLGMLETREAVEGLEEFASVEGLGGFFVGPSDLALAYGMQPGSEQARALIEETTKKLIDVATRSEWATGIFVGKGTQVGQAREAGFDYAVVGSDLGWLERFASQEIETGRQSGPERRKRSE